MVKEIFCTIGPSSIKPRVLTRLAELGINLFRINLSHTAESEIADRIDEIRRYTDTPICLDTEGAQIRTGSLSTDFLSVKENQKLAITSNGIVGNTKIINLHPLDITKQLILGDFISIDFNSVLAQVIDISPQGVYLRILNGGTIGHNKAVTVERPISMPPLTNKDIAALAIGRDKGIRHVALSFANAASDVDEIRSHVNPETFVISKIECRNGVKNLEAIANKSDGILIDRGDLSREYPVERIPALQKNIVRRSKDQDCKVYVATNLLESMVSEPTPTRAEVNDVHNTLLDGVDGLVLAAETAIGNHPVACANMIVRLIRAYQSKDISDDGSDIVEDATSLLVPPHGGKLTNSLLNEFFVVPSEKEVPQIIASDTALIDCEQIALGTYSPLKGFMCQDELESVLNRNCLLDGSKWTMPVTLQLENESFKIIQSGSQIALKSNLGIIVALLDVQEVWKADPEKYAQRWFGTTSKKHPGVERLIDGGNTFVAGRVSLIERLESKNRQFELTPAQTRFVFSRKGWSRVVGFHTRNVIHRVHEHIQLEALEKANADGIYISPISGPRKKGDFLPEQILKSYQLMLDQGLYPPGKVMLGSFASYPRYGGPREAVFTALCRKNMGCSHFVIGRDHTGVGDFYHPDANRKIFDELGSLGIEPIFFDAIGYDSQKKVYKSIDNESTITKISGTDARAALVSGKALPDWYMRNIIQDYLREEINSGKAIFSK